MTTPHHRWDADPNDRQAASGLVRELLASHPADEAVAAIWGTIEGRLDRFPTALAVELVRLDGPERLRSLLAELPRSPIEDFTRTTRRVLASRPVRREAATRLVRASQSELSLSAMLWDRTRYVPVEECDDDGLDAGAVLSSPVFDLESAVDQRIDQLNFVSEDQRQGVREAERLSAYQTYALRHGKLAMNDPRTGAPATYLGCYAHHDLVLYRFRGESDLVLVTGGVFCRVRGIYLPAEDLFVTLGAAASRRTMRNIPEAKAHLARALVRQRRRAGNATPGDAADATGVTVRIGGPENFAHLLWNYLSALDREILAGNLPALRHVVTVGSEYFGPIRDLYPELETAKVEERARGGVDDRFVADPRRVLVRLATALLLPEARDRIVRAADLRAADPPAQPLLDRVGSHRFPIYVALRVGDKAWEDAAIELPKLIDHLLEVRPDACVLLDGFSVPSGADYITDRWRPQVEALENLVRTILSRVSEPDRVIDLVGLDMLSSIALLRRARCYLTPVGTAHHKVDWLSDRPGVVYVSEEFNRFTRGEWTGFRQPLGSHKPRVVVGCDLTPESVRRQRPGDRRERLSNFTLAWTTVWAALEPLLEEPDDADSARVDADGPG